MVKNVLILLGLIITTFQLSAQTLIIDISLDTLEVGNQFDVTYKIDQSCRPDNLVFENFDIVSGPNISKSMSYLNGNLTAETSLSFTLKAREEGTFKLPDELCDTKAKRTPQVVVSNELQPIQKDKTKTRKNRKIKKI